MATTRRTFLKRGAVVAGAVAGASLPVIGPREARAGRDFDIALSEKIDRIVRTTCSPNCTGSCGQLAFVRDGKVVKVQQAADYPDKVYNPRGCMKGISYQNHIYGPDRIRTPLIRIGARGSGEFREAAWDEVLDRIAGELKRIGEAARLGLDPRLRPGSGLRLHPEGRQLPGERAARLHPRHELRLQRRPAHGHADHLRRPERGARGQGLGEQPVPAADRQQPRRDADPRRALHPRRGRGGRKAGRGRSELLTDGVQGGHLALDQARYRRRVRPRDGEVILAEGLADLEFMRTYTDAPLLVRVDTGRRLRWAEVRAAEPRVADAPDASSPGTRPPSARSGRDGAARGTGRRVPALDGTFDVALADGSTVRAAPGFALVRAEIERWTPDRAGRPASSPPERIAAVARAYATTKPAAILMGGGSNHWFHGDLTGRALALLAALTGNIGRSGGGFSVYVGQYKVRVVTAPWWNVGDTKAKVVPSIYFARGRTETMHPSVPYPKAGYHALVCTFANLFVQSMDVNRLHQTLAGCDLIVVVDHQITDTGRVGGHRPAGDHLVREDRPHRDAAPSVPPAPAAGHRPGGGVPL